MIFEKNGAIVTLSTVYDAALNDSNKSWVVPEGEVWKLNWAHVIFTTTATAGNRLLQFVVKNAAGEEVFSVVSAAVQGASISSRHYNFVQGVYRETAVAQNEIQTPIPMDCWLQPGFTLQIWDDAAVDAAADDLIASYQVEVYKPRFVA